MNCSANANRKTTVKGGYWLQNYNHMVPFDGEILALIGTTLAWSRQSPAQEPDQLRKIQGLKTVIEVMDKNCEKLRSGSVSG